MVGALEVQSSLKYQYLDARCGAEWGLWNLTAFERGPRTYFTSVTVASGGVFTDLIMVRSIARPSS